MTYCWEEMTSLADAWLKLTRQAPTNTADCLKALDLTKAAFQQKRSLIAAYFHATVCKLSSYTQEYTFTILLQSEGNILILLFWKDFTF